MPDRRRRPDPDTLTDPKTGRRLYARTDWVPEKGSGAGRILELLVDTHNITVPLAAYALQGETAGRSAFTPSHVGHTLTKLWRYGFARRFFRPVEPGRGSAAYVYLPTSAGAKCVLDPADWLRERKRIANRAANPATRYEHALGAVQLKIMWRLGSPAMAHLFETERWWPDRGLEFIVRVDHENIKLAPDQTALIEHKSGDFYRPIFFEIETAHKNYARQRQRFEGYRALVTTNADIAAHVIEGETGIVPVNGVVVFVTPTAEEAERMRRFAASVLQLGKKRMPEFWFGSFDQFVNRGVFLPPAALFESRFRNLRGEAGALIVAHE